MKKLIIILLTFWLIPFTFALDTDSDGIPDKDDSNNILDIEITQYKNDYAFIKEFQRTDTPIYLGYYPIEVTKIDYNWDYVAVDWTIIPRSSILNSYESAGNNWYRYNSDIENVTLFDETKLKAFVCTPNDVDTWESSDCISSSDNYPVENDSACCYTNSNIWKFSWSKFYKTYWDDYVDSDQDWVYDIYDRCENTPEWATDIINDLESNNHWCSQSEIDSDNDWIPDSEDRCNTKATEVTMVYPKWHERAWCTENDEDDDDFDWTSWVSTDSSAPWDNIDWRTNRWKERNDVLKDIFSWELEYFNSRKTWAEWMFNLSINLAYSLKNLFLIFASIYLVILVLKLFFSSSSDEELGKFKKWIVWTTVWIIVMQTAFSFTTNLYDKSINENLAANFGENIIQPFINLLLIFTSFAFIWIAIYSFYKIVTSNGDEEWAKHWKMSIVQAMIWFIVIKFTQTIVDSTYWKVECTNWSWLTSSKCKETAQVEWNMELIMNLINWWNSLLAIIITILVIYAWVNLMLSNWDEEKIKKAKQSIIYIAIWLLIIVSSYLILSFFIIPEVEI